MPFITKWPESLGLNDCLFCGCVAFLKWLSRQCCVSVTDWSSLFWRWHLTLSPDRSGIYWMSCKSRWAYGNTQMKVLWAQCQCQLTVQRPCSHWCVCPSVCVSFQSMILWPRHINIVFCPRCCEGVCVLLMGIEVWSSITLRGFISE